VGSQLPNSSTTGTEKDKDNRSTDKSHNKILEKRLKDFHLIYGLSKSEKARPSSIAKIARIRRQRQKKDKKVRIAFILIIIPYSVGKSRLNYNFNHFVSRTLAARKNLDH
jgi:hypothetical protein